MSKALTKADFFAPRTPPLRRVDVDLPGWEGHLFVRVLTGEERDDFELSCADRGDRRNVRARVVALCACDAAGGCLFTEDDARQLGRQDGRVLDLIFDAACEHNLLLAAGQRRAEKNSESPPGSGSPSDSPGTSG